MRRYLRITALLLLTACGGNTDPVDTASQWADAVVAGDYTTMQDMAADERGFLIWTGIMDLPFRRGELQDWHIIAVEQQGERTTMVRFQFTGGPSTLCTRVFVDDQGRVATHHAMVECAWQEAIR